MFASVCLSGMSERNVCYKIRPRQQRSIASPRSPSSGYSYVPPPRGGGGAAYNRGHCIIMDALTHMDVYLFMQLLMIKY